MRVKNLFNVSSKRNTKAAHNCWCAGIGAIQNRDPSEVQSGAIKMNHGCIWTGLLPSPPRNRSPSCTATTTSVFLPGQKRTPTATACSFKTKCFAISGELSTGKKVHTIHGGRKGTEDKHKGHTAHVLCMAISTDGKFLVS